jgi:hypothetical protein
MQLNVFADADGTLYLQLSSPNLPYSRHLLVPMLAASSPVLKGVDRVMLVDVWYDGKSYSVPYLLIQSEVTNSAGWKIVGSIEENDSRNVLNHILDILAWD